MNFKIGDIVKGSTLGYESKVGKIVKIDEDDQEFMYAIICDGYQRWLRTETVELIAEKPQLYTKEDLKKERLETTSDLLDNQPHYKNQGIEPINLMRKNFSREEFAGFLQGNVLKYMLRYKDKNGLEDLKKAMTYLTWLIEEEENNG